MRQPPPHTHTQEHWRVERVGVKGDLRQTSGVKGTGARSENNRVRKCSLAAGCDPLTTNQQVDLQLAAAPSPQRPHRWAFLFVCLFLGRGGGMFG